MKCTDFSTVIRQLHEQEVRELHAAVAAHGGRYVFFDCDADDADDVWFERQDRYENCDVPCIEGVVNWQGYSTTCYVTEVGLDQYGRLNIVGFTSDQCPSDSTEICEVMTGQLEEVIKLIPETDSVHNVSESLASEQC